MQRKAMRHTLANLLLCCNWYQLANIDKIICLMYTTVQKFGVGRIFFMFLKFSYARQGCVYLIKNAVTTVIF